VPSGRVLSLTRRSSQEMKGGQREAVDRGAADAARRAAGEQGDPPADGSAQGDDPEGVVVVDAARLFTAVAGPPQEALKRDSLSFGGELSVGADRLMV
jgi:hypothetical protein